MNIKTVKQLKQVLKAGKKFYKITYGDKTQYRIGDSEQEFIKKFVGWKEINVEQITLEEFILNKF